MELRPILFGEVSIALVERFAECLQQEIDRIGLPLKEIRRHLCDVSASNLYNWRKGTTEPSKWAQGLVLKTLRSLPSKRKTHPDVLP